MGESLQKLRDRVFKIIDTGTFIRRLLLFLIIFNAIAVVAGTVEEIHESYSIYFLWFEYISIGIFAIEYFLRLWTARNLFPTKEYPNVKNPYLQYIRSGYAIIDFLAFFPSIIFPVDLRFLRLLRILKLTRYNKSLRMITGVIKNEKDKLIIAFIFIIILILVSSSVLYFLEYEAQANMFPNIPATLWWAVSTLTTVGYGDVYPVTVLGKMLAGFISILAIGLVALPSGIISAGLINEMKKDNFNYNPEEIKKFITNVYQIRDNICRVCDGIAETYQNEYPDLLIQSNYGKSTTWFEGNNLGSSIRYNGNNYAIFCGLSMDILNVSSNKNDEYTYGLRIQKAILAPNATEGINKVLFPFISDNDHLYFSINKEYFLDQGYNDDLRKEIIRILECVLPGADSR